MLFRWILDTRKLGWLNNDDDDDAAAGIASTAITVEEFKNKAKTYLALLKPHERDSVLQYYHAKDSAMSLASHLLKYAAVARVTRLPWSSIAFAADARHKPCFVPPPPPPPQQQRQRSGVPAVEFNVSHQAGLVALFASAADNGSGGGGSLHHGSAPPLPPPPPPRSPPPVGVDVVCVHERDEYRDIDRDGFDAWVAMYADVFSPGEVHDMTYCLPSLRLAREEASAGGGGGGGDGGEGNRGSIIELSAEELGDAAVRCCRRGQSFSVRLRRRHRRRRSGTISGCEGHKRDGDEAKEGKEVAEEEEEKKVEDEELLTIRSDDIIEAKLRRFYAFWALKEAYIKMTGDALLADWLRELEFRQVRAPPPPPPLVVPSSSSSSSSPSSSSATATATATVTAASSAPPAASSSSSSSAPGGGGGSNDDDDDDDDDNNNGLGAAVKYADSSSGSSTDLVWGEIVRDIEIWFRGERVPDVTLELQALGRSYMVASAIAGAPGHHRRDAGRQKQHNQHQQRQRQRQQQQQQQQHSSTASPHPAGSTSGPSAPAESGGDAIGYPLLPPFVLVDLKRDILPYASATAAGPSFP